MKLTYRGTQYNFEPNAIDLIDSQAVGRYRGHAVTFQYPRHVPVQPVATLKYRGVPYVTTETGGVGVVHSGIQTQPAVADAAIARSASSVSAIATARQQALAEVAKVHHQNILRSLQHRLDVARAKGDEMLVAQLEREMQQSA